jgi:hypothetical protein
MKYTMFAASLAAVLALAGVSFGAPLYVEDFETDQTANWTVNVGPAGATNDKAFVFFDYSLAGIPPAPGSAPSDHPHGLKLVANLNASTPVVLSGVTASPTGKNFGPLYKVKFDWWSNFNGPAPAGGSGSTQLATFGVETNGTTNQIPGLASSVWFAATGDGNSAADWRAYSSAAVASYADGNAVYAPATTRNSSNAYYAGFGVNTAPAAQVTLFPQQTGTTLIGSSAWEWHQVVIDKTATNVTWTVDGLLIATVPLAGLTTNGKNIFFGQSDTNTTVSTDVNDEALIFNLIDNVCVVPEPSSLVLWMAVAVGALVSRRRL